MTRSNLSILYRGPLSSCNYGCPYCPFAKHVETREEHEIDRSCLDKFTAWAVSQESLGLSIFFTPWGEALIHSRYQEALIRLTNAENIEKAAIQTNLSCQLAWVERCNKDKLALWATYHPGEVERQRFLEKCSELIERRIRFSVGIVGLKENIEEALAIRASLPEKIYLWVNAFKRESNYYTEQEVESLMPSTRCLHLTTSTIRALGAPVGRDIQWYQ